MRFPANTRPPVDGGASAEPDAALVSAPIRVTHKSAESCPFAAPAGSYVANIAAPANDNSLMPLSVVSWVGSERLVTTISPPFA